jgi:SAM-dependent methyltransferase
MLINEAKWIGAIIPSLPLTKESIVLNFGSQSLKYNNENKQLMDFVINPLKERCQLRNLDVQTGPGIDYSGDLFDDVFFKKLKLIRFEGVLLCNVLEHVTNIEELARRVGELIKPGGFLIFTGPYQYPVHYDPIDNGFRPEVDEVVGLFAGYQKVKGDIITDFNYSYYMLSSCKQFSLMLLRVVTPFYKYKKWKRVVLPKFLWWNRAFMVTCVLMKKE